jgi:hypothetical protein
MAMHFDHDVANESASAGAFPNEPICEAIKTVAAANVTRMMSAILDKTYGGN